jgi:hypothetical protein
VFSQGAGGFEDLSIVDHGGAPGRAKIMERFANIPVAVKAGFHDIVVTFIERAEAETDEFVTTRTDGSFGTGLRAPRMIDGVTVNGPFNSPASRKRRAASAFSFANRKPVKTGHARGESSRIWPAARFADPCRKKMSIR